MDPLIFIIIQLAQQIFLRARLFYEFIATRRQSAPAVLLCFILFIHVVDRWRCDRARDTCKLPLIIHSNFYFLARSTVAIHKCVNIFDNAIFLLTSKRLTRNAEWPSKVSFACSFSLKKG